MTDVWYPAYVGLGSNLEEPERQILEAFTELGNLPECRAFITSPLYRSAPMGPQDQPDYVNAAAGFLTRLAPDDLMHELLGVEKKHGRIRDGTRWGPRILDLDLLVYSHRVIDENGLKVPHPGVHERNFVLYPLNDIAPTLFIPGRGRVAQLAARLDAAGLTRL